MELAGVPGVGHFEVTSPKWPFLDVRHPEVSVVECVSHLNSGV